MCEPCRNRYRSYGITKRAKWKAERAAFEQELETLREVEDEKRKNAGLAVSLLYLQFYHRTYASVAFE